MDMINDPAMKEIIDDFCDEATALFDELESTLEILEDDPSANKELETFGQIIDRIMGAAKSVGANEVAIFCELGKTIGYKSSQVNDEALIEVVTAILFDSIDLLRKMIEQIKTGNSRTLSGLNTKAFCTRLNWLSDKFKNIERSSCSVGEDKNKDLDQSSIDDLMASLGL